MRLKITSTLSNTAHTMVCGDWSTSPEIQPCVTATHCITMVIMMAATHHNAQRCPNSSKAGTAKMVIHTMAGELMPPVQAVM